MSGKINDITDMGIRLADKYREKGRETTGRSFSWVHTFSQEHKLIMLGFIVAEVGMNIFCIFIDGKEFYAWFKSLPFIDLIFKIGG